MFHLAYMQNLSCERVPITKKSKMVQDNSDHIVLGSHKYLLTHSGPYWVVRFNLDQNFDISHICCYFEPCNIYQTKLGLNGATKFSQIIIVRSVVSCGLDIWNWWFFSFWLALIMLLVSKFIFIWLYKFAVILVLSVSTSVYTTCSRLERLPAVSNNIVF